MVLNKIIKFNNIFFIITQNLCPLLSLLRSIWIVLLECILNFLILNRIIITPLMHGLCTKVDLPFILNYLLRLSKLSIIHLSLQKFCYDSNQFAVLTFIHTFQQYSDFIEKEYGIYTSFELLKRAEKMISKKFNAIKKCFFLSN